MSADIDRETVDYERPQDLARRWAEKCPACQRDKDAPDWSECTDSMERKTEPLNEAERLMFLDGVGRELLKVHVRGSDSDVIDLTLLPRTTGHIAETLGLRTEEAAELVDVTLAHLGFGGES